MTVRTRVAPSPSGDPHVGTAYVALFNLAFAKSQGGRFVLRIEDTDRARSSEASEERILAALRWAGIEWDEGPDVGGPHAPYRQSERLSIYQRHAQELLEAGGAFRCFCSEERIDALRPSQLERGQMPGYDGHCLGLDPNSAAERAAAGEPHVVRLRVPVEGVCSVQDRLRGVIETPWRQVNMQVLLKRDGFPTYHLAAAVDDHLMGITHVLRGDEWLSSMPKAQLIHECFGWELPEHAHLPLLRDARRRKLSKRRNPTGLDYFRAAGYLPEALLNYLALMGWSMPDERELFSLEELVAAFDLDRVSTGGPVFDMEKLNWLNGQHMRRLSPAAFVERVERWGINRERLERLAPLVQPRAERLSDVVPLADYLLGERPALKADAFAHKALSAEDCRRILHHALRALQVEATWESAALMARMKPLAAAMELKLRDFLFPLFVAIAGRAAALPLFDSMAFLGADLTRARLRSALDALGGISNKAAKRLDAEFDALPLAGPSAAPAN